MNYETVKAFGNEHLEISRYEELLNKLKKTAFEV
jgi:ABC-type transport system involved in Fe-S cluster assembly fused permease/ATPase subunit